MPSNSKKETTSERSSKRKEMSVPIIPEIIDATTRLGKGEIEVPKEIVEIEALIFSRGKLNAQFFRGIRKRYVVPSWVEKMLSPISKGCISLGHSSWFINSNYRDWIAFGGIDCYSEGIITSKGLVVPIIDGYGLLSGAVIEDKAYYITQDGTSTQELLNGYLPIGVNKWKIEEQSFEQIVYGGKSGKGEGGVLSFEKKSPTNSKLVISVRPFNQEGVSLIHSITYRKKDQAVFINKELAFRLTENPEKIASANYHNNGDSATKLLSLGKELDSDEVVITCSVGFANMTFIFPVKLQKLEVFMRMSNEPIDAVPVFDKIKFQWEEKLSQGLVLKTGNKEIDRLYLASLSNLLLLTDPGTITPGPTVYHRFWCRDAAFLINALDKTGYHQYAKDALIQFIARQRKDGFYYSHEGEFDSNGEGIWAFAEHAKFTKNTFWLEKVFESIERAAFWIIKTRKLEKKEAVQGKEHLVEGLLPPGFSAEHLGPCDYFYWDNFWGVAGLREAVYCAKALKAKSLSILEKEYKEYEKDLLTSLKKLYDQFQYLPVGPYRECDSAMIANLCAWHPTKVLDGKDEMLSKTADVIYQEFTHNGGFFHEVAWNCFGTYLTMHLAQVFVAQNKGEKVKELIDWLVKYQTCPMGWAEGISPQTMQGGMGDSPHGWASADWIFLLRNMFVHETKNGSLRLLSGYPETLLQQGISTNKLRTHYGELEISAILKEKKLSIDLNCNLTIPFIEIMTSRPVKSITVDNGKGEIIEEKCIKVSKEAKKITINF